MIGTNLPGVSLEHGWAQVPVVDFDLFLLLFSLERKIKEWSPRSEDHLSDPQAVCGGEGEVSPLPLLSSLELVW